MAGDRRVFIVDDDEAVGKALARVLASHGLPVETFTSPQSFLERPPHDGPACLLLDQKMPEMTGLEVQRALPQSARLPIVFISAHADVGTSVQAMKAGAADFLLKPIEAEVLLGAVERALATSAEALGEEEMRRQLAARLARLTRRERQVFEHVAAGLLNKQIAAEIGVSEKTVKIHRGHMMRKLGVGSVAGLARLAERVGVSRPGS
jgi:FixJ family two-component response regulator